MAQKKRLTFMPLSKPIKQLHKKCKDYIFSDILPGSLIIRLFFGSYVLVLLLVILLILLILIVLLIVLVIVVLIVLFLIHYKSLPFDDIITLVSIKYTSKRKEI